MTESFSDQFIPSILMDVVGAEQLDEDLSQVAGLEPEIVSAAPVPVAPPPQIIKPPPPVVKVKENTPPIVAEKLEVPVLERQGSAALLEANKALENQLAPEKPKPVKKLKKCGVCNETILGPSREAGGELYHEFCFVCNHCGDVVESSDEFVVLRSKLYHKECSLEVKFCKTCDEVLIGKGIEFGGSRYHKRCLKCSICSKNLEKEDTKEVKQGIACQPCADEEEKRLREEQERIQRQKQEEERIAQEKAAAQKQEAERIAQEKAAAQKKEEERVAEAERRRLEQEAEVNRKREEEARAREEQKRILAEQRIEAEKLAEEMERLRLEKELEFYRQSIALENTRKALEGALSSPILQQHKTAPDVPAVPNEIAPTINEGKEACGGCNKILTGSAISALNKFYHDECFKCAFCNRVLQSEEGYAEHDQKPYHPHCYQEQFGVRCNRCKQVMAGNVIKALNNMYHPTCFTCNSCNSPLTTTFFEENGQPVCEPCKQRASTIPQKVIQQEPNSNVPMATAAYPYAAQNSSQLNMNLGDVMQVLRKDHDGWWLVKMSTGEGLVPGAYVIEHPTAPAAAAPPAPQNMCSTCKFENPDKARFCGKCGSGL